MRFSEKLRLRVDQLEIPKAKLARKVEGLEEATISGYLARPDSIPRADIALKIAQAIQVPLDWLVDDQKGWPPPELPPQLNDFALMQEVCRRQRPFLIELLNALDVAEKADWKSVLHALGSWKPGLPLPSEMERCSKILTNLSNIDKFIERYEPSKMALLFHATLPGSDRPASDFNPGKLQERRKLLDSKPGYSEVCSRFEEYLKWCNNQVGFGVEQTAKAQASQTPPPSPPSPGQPPAARRRPDRP